MNIGKKIEELEVKIEEVKDSKKIKVMTLERKHFKKVLSVAQGFGYQDLKKKPKALFNTLITKGYNVHVEPTGEVQSFGGKDLDLYVILK